MSFSIRASSETNYFHLSHERVEGFDSKNPSEKVEVSVEHRNSVIIRFTSFRGNFII